MEENQKVEEVKEKVESTMDSVENKVEETKQEVTQNSKSGSKGKMIIIIGCVAVCFIVLACVVGLVVIGSLAGGSSTNEAKDIPSDWEKIEEDTYVIGHPSDWEANKYGGTEITISSPEEEIDFTDPEYDYESTLENSAFAGVNTIDKDDKELANGDEDKAKDMVKAIEDLDCKKYAGLLDKDTAASSVPVENFEKSDLNGLGACKVTFDDSSASNPQVSLYGELYYFAFGDKIYSVGYFSYSEDETDNVKTAKQIISTFNLKD